MKENIHSERITAVRNAMLERGIDYCYLRDADHHGSEYVSEHDRIRTYFSGFTGSNGNLLIGSEKAYLWTDGRYFIQAEQELHGSGIELMKMQQTGVLTVPEFICNDPKESIVFAFCGMAESDTFANTLNMQAKKCNKKLQLIDDIDFIYQLWGECRPARKSSAARILPSSLVGESYEDKLNRLRKYLIEQHADTVILTAPDEIMWLFNIRGNDIPCNPVLHSYAIITTNDVRLFLHTESQTSELHSYAREHEITICDYDCFKDCLQAIPKCSHILLWNDKIPYSVYRLLSDGNELIRQNSVIALWKAVKNKTEISHIRQTFLRDSAVVCKFLYWLQTTLKERSITECEAAQKMDHLRMEAGANDISFTTISAYGSNAAMMHYEAVPGHDATLMNKGFYLIDSGGQYDGGTTDVTRTVSLGALNQSEKEHFTDVVKGVLALQNAIFRYGSTGTSLDILARQFLWKKGEDYRCGTGHGIGYMLSVHEGPQSIRTASFIPRQEVAIEAGMMVSDEPGYYAEGAFGIRIENILLCEEWKETEYGKFYRFEPLTYVPIDMNALDGRRMTEEEKEALNTYHREVYTKIKPYLTKNEAEWLLHQTAPFDADR